MMTLAKGKWTSVFSIWRKGMGKGVEILASFHKMHSMQLSLESMLKSQPMHRLIFVSVLHICTKAICIALFSCNRIEKSQHHCGGCDVGGGVTAAVAAT